MNCAPSCTQLKPPPMMISTVQNMKNVASNSDIKVRRTCLSSEDKQLSSNTGDRFNFSSKSKSDVQLSTQLPDTLSLHQ